MHDVYNAVRRIAVAAAFLLLVSAAWATERHVNNGIACNDANAGTDPNLPKCTIQAAVNPMAAGDITTVHAGTYTSTGLNLSGRIINVAVRNKAGGSAGSRYVIHTAGDGPVILSGVANGQNAALYLDASAFVTFDGFTITGFNPVGLPDSRPATVYCTGSVHPLITNLTISGSVQTNSEVAEITSLQCYDGVISNNIITTGNKIGISYDGPTGYTGAAMNRVDTGIVQGNSVTNTRGVITAQAPAGMFVIRVNNTVVKQNYLNITDPNIDVNNNPRGVYLRDSQSVVLQENVIRGYFRGMEIHDANASEACGGCTSGRLDPNGVSTHNEFEQHIIKNNTFFGYDPNSAQYVNTRGIQHVGGLASCDDCILKNNIFASYRQALNMPNNSPATYPGTTTVDANLYYLNGTANNVGDGTETNAHTGNPVFVASGSAPSPYFNLTTSSPARDIGDNAYCPWTPSDGQCDAGAYEFIGGSSPSGRPGSIIISFDIPSAVLPQGSSPIGVISFVVGNIQPGHAVLYRLQASDVKTLLSSAAW